MWDKITELTNQHGYMSGVDRESDRVKATGEVYTPTELVIEILQKMLENDPEVFAPGKTVFDPAVGDGQLLVPVKWFKVIHHNMSEEDAEKDLYGVDLMEDNVKVCLSRLPNANIVCDDALNPSTPTVKGWFGISTLEGFF